MLCVINVMLNHWATEPCCYAMAFNITGKVLQLWVLWQCMTMFTLSSMVIKYFKMQRCTYLAWQTHVVFTWSAVEFLQPAVTECLSLVPVTDKKRSVTAVNGGTGEGWKPCVEDITSASLSVKTSPIACKPLVWIKHGHVCVLGLIPPCFIKAV